MLDHADLQFASIIPKVTRLTTKLFERVVLSETERELAQTAKNEPGLWPESDLGLWIGVVKWSRSQ